MLTDIEVKNFRGFRSLKMNDLARITLVGGRNGVGKTALLEALWIFSGSDLPELGERINFMRGLPSFGPGSGFHDMFFDYDIDSRIRMSARGDWEGNAERALEIFLQERQQIDAVHRDNPNHPNSSAVESLTRPQFESETEIVFSYKHEDGQKYTSRAWWTADNLKQTGVGVPVFAGEIVTQVRQGRPNRTSSVFMPTSHNVYNLDSLASMFSTAQLKGDMNKILTLIKLLEPRLKELTLITVNGLPIVHARLEGMKRLIPVLLLGSGLNRMLVFALFMEQASGGMILIDEIENGLHYRVQGEVFSVLLSLAKAFDVQIIATTHSRECINAAHHALNEGEKREFAFYRLDRRGEEVRAMSYDNEMLDTSIEFGMEIR